MNAKEFYDYITNQMSAEKALLKLLESSLIQYEHLKFNDKLEPVHPVLIISMAAMDLGWQITVEENQDDIRGLVVGTDEYMRDTFK